MIIISSMSDHGNLAYITSAVCIVFEAIWSHTSSPQVSTTTHVPCTAKAVASRDSRMRSPSPYESPASHFFEAVKAESETTKSEWSLYLWCIDSVNAAILFWINSPQKPSTAPWASPTLAKLATIDTKGLIHPRILLDFGKARAFVADLQNMLMHWLMCLWSHTETSPWMQADLVGTCNNE